MFFFFHTYSFLHTIPMYNTIKLKNMELMSYSIMHDAGYRHPSVNKWSRRNGALSYQQIVPKAV